VPLSGGIFVFALQKQKAKLSFRFAFAVTEYFPLRFYL